MFDVLADMLYGEPTRVELAKAMRFTAMFRMCPLTPRSWDLRGPAVLGVGRCSAEFTLRRWNLGTNNLWHCVTVDGVGNVIDQQTYDGCGNPRETPLDAVATACQMVSKYPAGWELRELIKRELAPIMTGWTHYSVDSEGRLSDEQ